MSTLNKRLAQLEKSVRGTGGARCTLCHGYPVAMLFITHEQDPDGPGFHKTGQRFLADGDRGRTTDDLRCRACGREAGVAHHVDVRSQRKSPWDAPAVGSTFEVSRGERSRCSS